MKTEHVPKWIMKRDGIKSQHAWRAQKRRQVRELRKALDNFRMGCAYVPGYPRLIDALAKNVSELAEVVKVKSWGK